MNSPKQCSVCERVFAWGADDDSAIVDAQGDHRKSCRENAFWKLTFHMQVEHSDALVDCPRKAEGAVFRHNDHRDYWDTDDGNRTCSYCGSMHPNDFFVAIASGAEIGPTDKSYKVYVDVPHPQAGQTIQIGSQTGPAFDRDGKPNLPDLTEAEIAAGRYDRPTMGVAATTQAKFYFQHLDEAGKIKFIDLVNAKKITFGYPGHLYVTPFFCQRASAA